MSHHLVGAAEIAEMLGVSRQRVDQLADEHPDFPAPEAELAGGRVWSRTAIATWATLHKDRKMRRRKQVGGMFERMTDRARRVVVLAQEEARGLRHGYIGTEHILLGLIHEGQGLAAKALESLNVTLEQVRAQVEETIGVGTSTPQGHIPFTPRAKKVLELSLREALKLGHNFIGTEHILLGLLREGEGVAANVMMKIGLDLPKVRDLVVESLSDSIDLPADDELESADGSFEAGDEDPHPPSGPGTPGKQTHELASMLLERIESMEARLRALEQDRGG